MKYVALITARSGSKGIVDKNIKELLGHPLIAWSIVACIKSKLIEKVFVSTDSKNYAEIAKFYGAEVPFLRPVELAGDKSTDYEVFEHAVNFFEKNEIKINNFVHIRPTTPLRSPDKIDEAIYFFDNKNENFSALRSIHEMPESAYKSFELKENGNLKSFSNLDSIETSNLPRQSFPKTYVANGYIDILKTMTIKVEKDIHGKEIHGFLTPITHEIDTIEDFDYIEWQVQKNPEIFKQLFEEK